MSIGQDIRKRRRALGMTQKAVGFQAGVSQPRVSDLERDRKSPTLKTLSKIAKVLQARLSVKLIPWQRRLKKSAPRT